MRRELVAHLRQRAPLLAVLAVVALVLAVLAALEGCTPRDREAVRTIAPPLQQVTCVLLRAFTSSGTLEEICATADELAPLVPQLLAERAAREGRGVAAMPSGAALAFSLPPPSRPVPRRRCVQWVDLPRSTDASAPRASGPNDAGGVDDGGRDGGE